MLNLDILVWEVLLLAVFALLGGLWFRRFMRVQTAHRGRRPRAKVIPINSYRPRKTRSRNFG